MFTRSPASFLLILGALACRDVAAFAADPSASPATIAPARWPQFRGPGGSGVADSQNPPTQFGPSTNLLWKTPLPAGHSSPCIWDDRIFLTAYSAGKLETLCLSRRDGKILWRTPLPQQKLEPLTGANSPATATPTTDGQRVYAYFGSFGVVAYDMDGREAWRKQLPVGNVRHGSGTSPVLASGKLIINGDQERWASSLMALDPATGEIVWKTPRPQFLSSHTTPVQWTHDGADEIIVAGSVVLAGYDLKDGSERWRCAGLEAISICSSPVVGDGVAYALSYSVGETPIPTWEQILAEEDTNKDGKISVKEAHEFTRGVFSIIDTNNDGFIIADEYAPIYQFLKQGKHGLFAMRAPGTGDVTATHTLWTYPKAVAEVASPLYYRGRIYFVRSGGMLTCIDAKTGTPFYENKRIGAPGDYFASPVAAGGRIYFSSRNGVVTVIEPADELKVLARNELGEAIVASPAIADHKFYIRTKQNLWAFGANQ
jgi:outer membrane protein assembly factor BamB